MEEVSSRPPLNPRLPAPLPTRWAGRGRCPPEPVAGALIADRCTVTTAVRVSPVEFADRRGCRAPFTTSAPASPFNLPQYHTAPERLPCILALVWPVRASVLLIADAFAYSASC